MAKDFNSKKFYILLSVVCVLFLILVVNAFMYLPKNTLKEEVSANREGTVNRQIGSNVNIPRTNQQIISEEKNPKKTLNVKLPNYSDEVDIVELDAPPGVNVSKDEDTPSLEVKEKELSSSEKAELYLKEGTKYRASKQYIKALDEYQRVLNLDADKMYNASAYDGIASLYAINKRYGSALSYAIKAYNMYPTTERELVLARLYYKTGDISKATQRVNNILRREFSDDRW